MKFTTAWNLPIILEEFIEYTPIQWRKTKGCQIVTGWTSTPTRISTDYAQNLPNHSLQLLDQSHNFYITGQGPSTSLVERAATFITNTLQTMKTPKQPHHTTHHTQPLDLPHVFACFAMRCLKWSHAGVMMHGPKLLKVAVKNKRERDVYIFLYVWCHV